MPTENTFFVNIRSCLVEHLLRPFVWLREMMYYHRSRTKNMRLFQQGIRKLVSHWTLGGPAAYHGAVARFLCSNGICFTWSSIPPHYGTMVRHTPVPPSAVFAGNIIPSILFWLVYPGDRVVLHPGRTRISFFRVHHSHYLCMAGPVENYMTVPKTAADRDLILTSLSRFITPKVPTHCA